MDLLKTLTDATDSLGRLAVTVGNVFDDGLEIYSSYVNRIKAIDTIQEETVKTPAPQTSAQAAPSTSVTVNSAVILGAVGLILFGILISKRK